MALFVEVQGVAHTLLLGAEVALIVGVRLDFDGHVFDYFKTVGLKSHALDGVVGDEAHLFHAEQVENLCTHAIVALVGVVAQMDVGVDSVVALLLEFVGGNLAISPMPRPSWLR